MSTPPASFESAASSLTSGRQRTRLLAVALVGLLSATALARSLGPATAGEIAAWGRLALGALGLGAAALLAARPALGYRVAIVWATLQVPFIAWTPHGGSPFSQGFDFPVTFSSHSTVNGVTTSYLALGINLVGPVALALLRSRRHALTTR